MKTLTTLTALLIWMLPAAAQTEAVPIDEGEVFAIAQRLADGDLDASTRVDEAFRLQVLWDYVSRIKVPITEDMTDGPETDNPTLQIIGLDRDMTLADVLAGIASAEDSIEYYAGGNSDNVDSAQDNLEHWQEIEAHVTQLLDYILPTLVEDEGWDVASLIGSVGELREQLAAEENAAAIAALNGDAAAQTLREQYGETLAQTLEVDPGSWAGEWTGWWGGMTLTVSGTSVTGTYTHDDGHLTGVLLPGGRVIEGTWNEPKQVGRFRFTLSADGQSFTGVYGHGDADPTSDWSYARPEAE